MIVRYVQGRSASLVSGTHIGSSRQQQFDPLRRGVPLLNRIMERSLSVVGPRVYVGTRLEKEHDDGKRVPPDCIVQRSISVSFSGQYVRAGINQNPRTRYVAQMTAKIELRKFMEGRVPVVIQSVHVRPGLQKGLEYRRIVTSPRCLMQWGGSARVARIHTRPGVEQHLDKGQFVLPDRMMQWRARQIPVGIRIHVCTGIQASSHFLQGRSAEVHVCVPPMATRCIQRALKPPPLPPAVQETA